MTEPIPLARPDVGQREEELVLEVLRSGRFALGPMGRRFEEAFAEWVGAPDAIAVSSGTAALHLGVRALGWQAGDEVVTTPFSFVASANCLLYEDVKPVFCDVDPVTLNIDLAAADAAVGEATVGLLPVDILGYPAEIAAAETLAGRRGLGVLEDACEALGAVDGEGRRIGAAGLTAAFAFYPNKQLTTGEGGMLIPADERAAELARSERNQGRSDDMEVVDHVRLGFNYRLSDIAAAVGVAQLERLDELLAARARVAAWYGERLAELGAPAGHGDPDGLVLPCADRGAERRSWFVYTVRLPKAADRDAVLGDLGNRGIEAKAYMPSIHLMSHVRDQFGFRRGQFPVAEDASARLLSLPFFPAMTEDQVERVFEALDETLSGSWV
ncbi:MAG TPA: DegT/DnrJ/EryC1/StrS family aminotransferase [Solirubrobacterales bacterium]